MALDPNTLSALADMLTAKDADVDSDSDLDDGPVSRVSKMNPGDVGSKSSKEVSSTKGQKKGNSKDIWDEEEVVEGAEFDDVYDAREQPEYDVIFKQKVTSEDMYLQMGNKTPATASCEDMVVKIKLPGAKSSDITLDVKTKFLDCRTSRYKLGLHLMHPVDHQSGKAQWDKKKEELSVTLTMKRDLDFMNF